VAHVETRVVMDVTLDVPGLTEPATGRLVSIPGRHPPQLNQLHLRQGRYPDLDRPGEVLVNEPFARAHRFAPGVTLGAIINGRWRQLLLSGVALSPEFIYQIRPGELFPDNLRFSVFWMPYPELAAAFDMEGAFNNVVISLSPGASEAEVIYRLDQLTAPYGGLGAYARKEQQSHQFLSSELQQLRAMAYVPPIIFLSVAAFLLNVVISRLITTQREQIAALKAFGYTNREVGFHYLQFGLIILAGSLLLGIIGGFYFGRGLTRMYAQFFHFPEIFFFLDGRVVLLAAVIGACSALIGVLGAVRQAVSLPPAEALRPEPPARYRPTLVERIGLQRYLGQPSRMILRHLERKPLKSLLSTLGISLATAVLVLGNFSSNVVDYLLDFQFNLTQRQDLTVAFVEPVSWKGFHELSRMPGVLQVEPFRSVPVRLRSGHRARRLSLLGLPPEGELLRLLDVHLNAVHLPEEGVILSKALGEILEVNPGDLLTVEVLEHDRPVRQVTVAGFVEDYSGTAAYMQIGALRRLMREGPSLSGAFLRTDPLEADNLYRQLKATPRVAVVSSKRAAWDSFQQVLDENLLRMRAINILFATIIAFGVVYNSARITLSETSRDLATLRVIGFTRREISFILLGEVAVLSIAALPLGVLLGYGFAALATAALQTETQRFPLVVNSSTYGFAVIVIAMAAFISGLVVRRRLDQLDLVAVLKSRE
jgi:putative ABC transport system permease protein